MTHRDDPPADWLDRAFGLLQRALPQHALSRGMHRLARSEQPAIRRSLIRFVLRSYPQIDLSEAAEPDPYAYPSFNAFFTRALRADARPVATEPQVLVSPVDGTVSRLGRVDPQGRMLQAKGLHYTPGELLADGTAAERYGRGQFACLYLAPYNYHRIHMPLDGRLVRTRYLPGALFSVNAATARTIPGLFGRNERVVCEFETAFGPLALVLVGALFVGSIETVWTGEVNPPGRRGGGARPLESGEGRTFAKGAEIGRFNMGSTVVLLLGHEAVEFAQDCGPATPVRMGQALARCS